MSEQRAPSADVWRAFGARESPAPITGGQGGAYRSGHVVLKPAKDDAETNWIAAFYLSVESDHFCLPRPIRARNDRFVWNGWQAWEYVPGAHKKGRWPETIELCVRFHRAIADFARPVYFDRREPNPWVAADKVAWGEMEIEFHPRIAPVVARLRQCLDEVTAKPQLIHGDFGGNVLFGDERPPTIIDFSPYWRPVEFAVGVIVADAIVWGGAEMSLLDAGNRFDNFYQHLARAELRRVIELETLRQMYGRETLDQIDAHLPLVRAIYERCHCAEG